MNLHIQRLSPSDLPDFEALIRCFGQAFEMADFPLPEEGHLRALLGRPDFWAVAAKAAESGEVLGGLTAYFLPQYYVPQPLAYLYDLAVGPAFQRRGVGGALLRWFIAQCRAEGAELMFAEAEADDLDAVRFYRAGPARKEMQVLQFTYGLSEG